MYGIDLLVSRDLPRALIVRITRLEGDKTVFLTDGRMAMVDIGPFVCNSDEKKVKVVRYELARLLKCMFSYTADMSAREKMSYYSQLETRAVGLIREHGLDYLIVYWP